MPIFRANGELHIFLHVPKCAGTTIEAHLSARFGQLGLIGMGPGRDVSLQHLTWDEIVSIFPQAWITESFAVVRHPVSRFVSAYNMRITQGKPPFPREISITDFLDWTECRLPKVPSLLDNHLRPQVDFVGPDTKIFRLEDGLDAVLAYLDEVCGSWPDAPPLGHVDFRDPAIECLFDSKSDLPAGVVERVAKLYAKDYEYFGYAFEPDSPVKLKTLKPEQARRFRRGVWLVRSMMRRLAIQAWPGRRD